MKKINKGLIVGLLFISFFAGSHSFPLEDDNALLIKGTVSLLDTTSNIIILKEQNTNTAKIYNLTNKIKIRYNNTGIDINKKTIQINETDEIYAEIKIIIGTDEIDAISLRGEIPINKLVSSKPVDEQDNKKSKNKPESFSKSREIINVGTLKMVGSSGEEMIVAISIGRGVLENRTIKIDKTTEIKKYVGATEKEARIDELRKYVSKQIGIIYIENSDAITAKSIFVNIPKTWQQTQITNKKNTK